MHAHHYDDLEPELGLTLPTGIGDHLGIAREVQLKHIREANERHRLALAAIETLNRQLTRARLEKEHAYRALRDLMAGRTNVVIGNTLIRFIEGGGVDISACEVIR